MVFSNEIRPSMGYLMIVLVEGYLIFLFIISVFFYIFNEMCECI